MTDYSFAVFHSIGDVPGEALRRGSHVTRPAVLCPGANATAGKAEIEQSDRDLRAMRWGVAADAVVGDLPRGGWVFQIDADSLC
jgi:hypothetical protein